MVFGAIAEGLGLTGSEMQGHAIDPNAFKIKDAEKYQQRADTQFEESKSRSSQALQDRRSLIAQLQAQARGEGPSLAAEQLKAAQDRNLAQQMAFLQANRGGNAQTNLREAMKANQQLAAQNAQAAAQARIMESTQARQELGTQLSQEQRLADELTQQYLTQGFGIVQAQQQAAADMQRLAVQQSLGLAGVNQQVQAGNIASTGRVLSGVAQGVGSIAGGPLGDSLMKGGFGGSAITDGSSDERGKKDVKPAKDEMKEFLDKLEAKGFKYKDTSKPGTAEGQRYGIMAQALEKSKVGKSLVKNTPNGKMVDTVQGFGAVLAAQAELNKRLSELEKKSKKA
ncbi:MAG: hypothetical protein FMNOHCHN_03738 [Ignavibacteriaceae bacterium]|nr:hypothetical protein [Ignavibacteriaceae bacterium]